MGMQAGSWLAQTLRPVTGLVLILVIAAGLQPASSDAAASQTHLKIEAPPDASSGSPVPMVTSVLASPPSTVHREIADADNPSSDSVGATVSEFHVDESDAMNYTVPLYVPPGSAGFAPQLSLEYSSRGARGPLGPGWGIGGLSSVTLCRKGKEYGDGNGPFAGLGFDANDTNNAWCLDGLRLLDAGSIGSCPGRAGYTGRAYTLELDQSTRLCGYRSDGTPAVAYWLVFPKDGTLQRYGFTTDSRLAPNNGIGAALPNQVLNWALDRRVDAAGNSIDYVYTTDIANGEQLISEIRYTGHVNRGNPHTLTQNRAPYQHIGFAYDAMPGFAPRIDWLAGSKVTQSKRLRSVTVWGLNNNNVDGANPDEARIARRYQLDYTDFSTGSRASLLTSLKECAPNPSGGEVCYPPTRLDWGAAPTQGFPATGSTGSYASSMGFVVDSKVGDINGDGRQDLVWVQCKPAGGINSRFEIMISLSTGTTLAAPIATGIHIRRATDSSCATDLRSLYLGNLWHLHDFTGDGRDDLLFSNGMTWSIVPAKTAGTNTTFPIADSIATGVPSQYLDDGYLIDMNGDTLPDLLHIGADGSGAVRLLDCGNGSPACTFQTSDLLVDIDDPIDPSDLPNGFQLVGASLGASLRRGTTAADIDGDGASDLALRVKYEDIEGPCPTCFGVPLLPASVGPEAPAVLFRHYWFVYRNAGMQPNGRFRFAADYQAGTIGLTTPSTHGTIANDGDDLWLTDINGDGQADLVYKRINGGGRYYVYRLNQGKPDIGVSGDKLSHAMHSTFTSDVWGNVIDTTLTSRREQRGNLVTDEVQSTSNVYGCTQAPPTLANCNGPNIDSERQRMGRLSISTVTTTRPGTAAVVRRASFEYDGVTGLLLAEIQGPYTAEEEPDATVRASLGLRTDCVRDNDGNITLEVTCSTAHFANRAACMSLAAFQQRQWPDDLTKIQRYRRIVYDNRGRFALATKLPFFSATEPGNVREGFAGAAGFDVVLGAPDAFGQIPPVVLSPSGFTPVPRRNVFGDPLNRLDAAGNLTIIEYGLLGRSRFQNDHTGAFARTRLAWCQDVVNADIPGSYPRVNCPLGARYRVLADSTGESGAFAFLSLARALSGLNVESVPSHRPTTSSVSSRGRSRSPPTPPARPLAAPRFHRVSCGSSDLLGRKLRLGQGLHIACASGDKVQQEGCRFRRSSDIQRQRTGRLATRALHCRPASAAVRLHVRCPPLLRVAVAVSDAAWQRAARRKARLRDLGQPQRRA